MNTVKTGILLVLISLVMLGASSCKKIQEDTFIKGLWRINGMYFDSLTQNQMYTHFPGFVSGNSCCIYKVDFQADNVVFGYYLKNDSFASVVIGNWEITKYNQIHLSLDSFADGLFDIEKTTVKKYKLTSAKNHIKYYDGVDAQLDTTYTRIDLERI